MTIPDDLIFDNILPRLPVKSILRFKSVSKVWRNTISTRQLKNSHLAFSSKHRSFYNASKTESMHSRVAGSCNGLVGLYSALPINGMELVVINPATNQRFVDIDVPDYLICSLSCVYWFGYVSSIDEYKFVAFDYERMEFSIYSFKRREWSRKQKHSSFIIDGRDPSFRPHPAQVDDSLYWPVIGSIGESYGSYVIEVNLVSGDLEVKPKVNFAAIGTSRSLLFNLKGCLVLHQKSESDCYEVWRLRRKDDWNSWERIYSKVHKDVKLLYVCMTGKLVIHYRNRKKVAAGLKQLMSLGRDDEEIPSSNKKLNGGVGNYYESLIWPF